MMNGQNTWRRLVINTVATIDKRWLRYIVPSLIVIYTLSLVGWLAWAMPQVGQVKVAAILPHNPNFLAVIIGALIVHLVVSWVLLAQMVMRRRFATLLLGAWFAIPAPIVLATLFTQSGFAALSMVVGCGILSLLVLRYYESQVPHAGALQTFRMKNGFRRKVLGIGAVVALGFSFAGPEGINMAEVIILSAVLILWLESDMLALAAETAAYFGSIGLLLIGWSFSSNAPNWYYALMGLAWLGALLFWEWVEALGRSWFRRLSGNQATHTSS